MGGQGCSWERLVGRPLSGPRSKGAVVSPSGQAVGVDGKRRDFRQGSEIGRMDW